MDGAEVQEVKIYTRAGDNGSTGLLGGSRVSKSSTRISAIGEIDELNAAIGFARVQEAHESVGDVLSEIQNWLFDTGAEVASPGDSRFLANAAHFTERLEASIDSHNSELPELKNFILPGGSELAARLHLARAVCRRCERCLVQLAEEGEFRPEVLTFMNRLSDWLFVAARTANLHQNVSDVSWTRSNR